MGANNCKGLLPGGSRVGPGKSTKAGKPEKYDYIEDVVCNEKDINENEMKLLPLGEDGGKILLIKQKGELHAIGTKCTHYGALLHTGALGDGRLRCPWHGACFNIKTGDIEDYPGLDSLPCYKVNVDDAGLVRVKARRKDLDINKRVKEMSKQDSSNSTTIAIVGGGPAGATCTESLRQEGFTGNIVMICKENVVPYDRVKVSKVLDFDVEKSALRPQSYYNDHKIDLKLGIAATGLNISENVVELSNKEKLAYNYLFICTGSKPRMVDVPGANLSNIFVLRDYTDSHSILSQLSPNKNVVILGLSFIGMEAAAYCVGKCASVTVVGRDTVPLRAVFGAEIGDRVRKEFEEKGINFLFEKNIAQFIAKEDEKNAVGTVELTDGTNVPADIAIIGIGSTFYTDWLKGSSIEMLQDGSIVVDKVRQNTFVRHNSSVVRVELNATAVDYLSIAGRVYLSVSPPTTKIISHVQLQHLRTNVENVYAGGDIAYAPVFGYNGISAAVGHYSLAHYHGKIAALNMCGKTATVNSVPFFWTTLFGKSYRYAGHGKPNRIKIHGSLENFEFFAYYILNGKVIAMCSVGADPVVSDFANYLHEGNSITEEEINSDPFGWIRNKPKDLLKRFENETVINV